MFVCVCVCVLCYAMLPMPMLFMLVSKTSLSTWPPGGDAFTWKEYSSTISNILFSKTVCGNIVLQQKNIVCVFGKRGICQTYRRGFFFHIAKQPYSQTRIKTCVVFPSDKRGEKEKKKSHNASLTSIHTRHFVVVFAFSLFSLCVFVCACLFNQSAFSTNYSAA